MSRSLRMVPTYLVLLVAFAVVCFPVYYAVVGSFMGSADINSFPAALWPENGWQLGNFAEAMRSIPLARQYVNSVVMAGLITVGQVATSVLAAYAFAFLPMRGRTLWFAVFLVTMMIPGEAIIIPNFLLISDVGLINTIPGLVLPFLASGFGVFLLRQAFLSFPTELRDAARIDGAGHVTFVWRILLPVVRPTLAALAIYSFLNAWNMYFWPLLVTQTPQMQTIQIGITQLRSAENFNGGMVLAGALLAVLPTVALVVFGQRLIVRGLTAGSLK